MGGEMGEAGGGAVALENVTGRWLRAEELGEGKQGSFRSLRASSGEATSSGRGGALSLREGCPQKGVG